MIEVSRAVIAQLRGVTPNAVSKAKLPQTDSGNYDLTDPEVWAYVTAPTVEKALAESRRANRETELTDADLEELKEEKLRAEIEWKQKQTRKLDLEHEVDKRDLVPSEVIGLWIGYFASGIRNNFLTLAKRVSRGDEELQKRIDRQVTKSIEKTLSSAERELRKEVESIAKRVSAE